MAKVKNNEQVIKDFLKNADGISIAVARAVLVENADKILADPDAIRKHYENSMLSGDVLIRSAEQVKKYLGFEGDK